MGYGLYGTTDTDKGNRNMQHMKSHQQVSTSGQVDNSRPIEEMPYQVRINLLSQKVIDKQSCIKL